MDEKILKVVGFRTRKIQPSFFHLFAGKWLKTIRSDLLGVSHDCLVYMVWQLSVEVCTLWVLCGFIYFPAVFTCYSTILRFREVSKSMLYRRSSKLVSVIFVTETIHAAT